MFEIFAISADKLKLVHNSITEVVIEPIPKTVAIFDRSCKRGIELSWDGISVEKKSGWMA